MENKTYKIIPIMDHYEVYYNGKFYCSADTIHEAAKEVEGNDYE